MNTSLTRRTALVVRRRPRRRARRGVLGLRPRPRQPADRVSGEAPALQPRRPDREGRRDDDEDRADRAAGLLDRLVRRRARAGRACSADRLGRERGDPEGHLDRRQRPDRRGLALPVPRAAREERHLHVPGRSRPTRTARSSTGPAPSRAPTRRRRSRRRARSAAAARSLLTIVALVVGAVGVVLGAVALLAGGGGSGSSHERGGGPSCGVWSWRSWRCSCCRPRRRRTPT